MRDAKAEFEKIQNLISKGSYDEISHAPITGREFLVYIKDCPVEYRGPELKDMTVEWVDSN